MANKLRVLIADDNECLRTLFNRMLASAPWESIICADGEEAWEEWQSAKAAGKTFDVVVLDYHMPRLNGLQVALRIRETEMAESLKPAFLAFMTAYFEELGEVSEGSNCADLGIWQKPQHIMGFADRISALLEAGQST